jgi:hypothetical protein
MDATMNGLGSQWMGLRKISSISNGKFSSPPHSLPQYFNFALNQKFGTRFSMFF